MTEERGVRRLADPTLFGLDLLMVADDLMVAYDEDGVVAAEAE